MKTVYEEYLKKNKGAFFGLYGYSPPNDGTYRLKVGEELSTGEDYRTVERYKEYREAGFNILLMQLTGRYNGEEWEGSMTKKVMDMAYQAGLKRVIVYDDRLYDLCKTDDGIVGDGKKFASEKELDEFVKECVQPYKTHPAFYGIQLLDEPDKNRLVTVGQVYKSIKRALPKAFVQCNLFPMMGPGQSENRFPGDGCYVEKFKAYLEMFLDVTGADYIMYDTYPIAVQWWESNIGRFYQLALQTAAQVCKERGVELHIVAQVFEMLSCGELYQIMPSEAQLRWQINHLLGFGVRELSYFTYWTKQHSGDVETFIDGKAMMTRDGKKTQAYYQVQKINAEITAFASVLKDFEYVASRYEIKTPLKSHPLFLENSERMHMDGVKASTDSEVAFITKLQDKKSGQEMYAVINATDPSYEDKIASPVQNTTLEFDKKYKTVDVFEAGEWRTEKIEGGKYTATLKPGYAQFILPY